jgi:hypothetical protein
MISKWMAFFTKKDGIVELTTLQHHGQPVRLMKKGDEWILASNPNMRLISHGRFTDLLKGDRSAGLGNVSIPDTENPMGFGSKYLVFHENSSGITSQNFLFLIPEEKRDDKRVSEIIDDSSGHVNVNMPDGEDAPYGLFGLTEPSKLSQDEDTLAVQCIFLAGHRAMLGATVNLPFRNPRIRI